MHTINSRFLHFAGVLLMALSSGVAMAQTQTQSKKEPSEVASMSMDHSHMMHQDMAMHSMSQADMMHPQMSHAQHDVAEHQSQPSEAQLVQKDQQPQSNSSSKHLTEGEKTHAQH